MESDLESLLSQIHHKSHNIALDFDGVIAENPIDISIKVFETFDRLLGKYDLVGRIIYRPLYEILSLNGRKPNKELINTLNGRPVYILTTNSEYVREIVYKYAKNAGLEVKEVYALPPGKREREKKYEWINKKLQELKPVIHITDDPEVIKQAEEPEIKVILYSWNGQNSSTNNPKIGYFKYLI
ncbi:MAG: hypothetical protein RAK22_02095 [Nanoarchaeota archaeon]|nr:hypothetical protein [Nanoarchaeota archaeon]